MDPVKRGVRGPAWRGQMGDLVMMTGGTEGRVEYIPDRYGGLNLSRYFALIFYRDGIYLVA
jgi:hypothetical protein